MQHLTTSIFYLFLQNNDQEQHLVNNFQNQKGQEDNAPSVAVNSSAAFVPPDVTHQANDIKPDLIQDVTKEQPDLTKRENGLQQPMGEPEKV